MFSATVFDVAETVIEEDTPLTVVAAETVVFAERAALDATEPSCASTDKTLDTEPISTTDVTFPVFNAALNLVDETTEHCDTAPDSAWLVDRRVLAETAIADAAPDSTAELCATVFDVMLEADETLETTSDTDATVLAKAVIAGVVPDRLFAITATVLAVSEDEDTAPDRVVALVATAFCVICADTDAPDRAPETVTKDLAETETEDVTAPTDEATDRNVLDDAEADNATSDNTCDVLSTPFMRTDTLGDTESSVPSQ